MSDTNDPETSGALFEARRKVFPKAVNGSFRRLKWAIMAVTLLIYYATPWLRWHRGDYAPDQAVLVDLAHSRFYMFSIEIWPQEFYYVTGLLVMAAMGLFLVTSLVGRAWCGYACPQTVWTDLFVHVERFVDGDRNAQIRLQAAPWTIGKIARRVLKHAIWLFIGVLTGGAWIFYFADAPTLAHEFISGQAPFVAYATVGILTATTYVLGGLMREQVCIYMCPWPRIQGAMMDEHSLIVTYKDWRGEPRSHGLKRAATETGAPAFGDCIDCDACVSVCPTGIDIRKGSQIGCITCGLCIDACDGMMQKIGRPPRLIGYAAEEDAKLAAQGLPQVSPLRRLFRVRPLIYLSIWSVVGLLMLVTLTTRTHIGIGVLQSRNPIYVQLSDGSVRNGYTLKISNMEARPREVEISLSGIDGVLWDENGSRATASKTLHFHLAADQVTAERVFVAAPAAATSLDPSRVDVTFTVRALDSEGGSATDNSFFERPEAGKS